MTDIDTYVQIHDPEARQDKITLYKRVFGKLVAHNEFAVPNHIWHSMNELTQYQYDVLEQIILHHTLPVITTMADQQRLIDAIHVLEDLGLVMMAYYPSGAFLGVAVTPPAQLAYLADKSEPYILEERLTSND